MKKIIALIISAMMLLSLSSCANSNGTSTADKETTNDAVSGEDADGNSDATKNNNSDAGAIVLLPDVYDIVFVKDGKAVAVMQVKFFDESSIQDKSDDELRAMMKDF